MLDINLVRKDLPAVVAGLEKRAKPQAFLDFARREAKGLLPDSLRRR